MKRPTFYALSVEAGGYEPGNLGDRENFIRIVSGVLLSYLDELRDGETETFEFGRVDMSEADEEKLPEL